MVLVLDVNHVHSGSFFFLLLLIFFGRRRHYDG